MTPDGGPVRAGRAPVLVLGVGNELFTDEGLGCVAATMVAERVAGLGLTGIDVLDGATLGLALLPELAGRSAVLLLDAMLSGRARPGDLLELHGEEVPARRHLTVSAHQIGVEEALSAAELADARPGVLAALGLVPVDLAAGYGLSPLIASRMEALAGRATALAVTMRNGVQDAAGHDRIRSLS